MSNFVNRIIESATAVTARGIVTGEPVAAERQNWAEVHDRARAIAGALVDGGLRPGSVIGVLAGAPALIAPAVQAVWLAGGSVTMLHQPTPRTDLKLWAEDTLAVVRMINSDLVLLGEPFETLASVLDERGIRHVRIADLDGEPILEPVERAETDTALLQLTSGSTAQPKAVRITHGNLISNIRGLVARTNADPKSDVMVSWLPLFHDMGMVGNLTVAMTEGIELVKLTPLDFLTNPLVWPEMITKYRGTFTAAPNFAYAITQRRLSKVVDDHAYDLSSLRIAMNGAEPIDPVSVNEFTSAAARFGLQPRSVVAAYGMAEATIAISFEIDLGLEVDEVDADALEVRDRAVPAADGPTGGDRIRTFARLGRLLPELEVRVVGKNGALLADREVGELQFRGGAISPGYLTADGPVASQDTDGWFASGDVGYLVDGQIVLCGRRKDVIIVGGRNIYPTDIERVANEVDGVRAGNVAAVRVDAGAGREEFAVLVESRLASDAAGARNLAREVTTQVANAVNARPSTVVVLPPGSLLKTPSGKIRRAASATHYSDRFARVRSPGSHRAERKPAESK